ncbi:homeobox protein cut-like 1 isoform X1 [Ptychodera flava]|uniref:homeobox protein cut-like 1 isoform X1 n=1 Tax=Ptychodera flava TaxID=63121 RepID=UPI00396A2F83
MAAANLASMNQYWKTFDLPQLQRELDSAATDLANRQDESDSSRKRLVEQSREFKKNTPEDIRKMVAPLLKSFQLEVDALSKRSKAAEAAFLSVYKKFIDVPDPVPVLEHAMQLQKKVQRAQDLEVENQKLRETLDEYNHEFAEVKNQEVTIKTLKEKLKEFEEKMEAVAQSRAKEKEKDLQREFAEKERQLQETQLNVATKLGEAEHKVATLQSALDSTQSELFDLKAKHDEQTAAKSDETDMIMTDLERANQRATSLEKEIESMKVQLMSANEALRQAEQMQKAPNMEQAIDILTRSSLEVELSAKEKEISQLVDDLQRLQASNAKLRDTTSQQVTKLEEQLAHKATALKKLEEKIKNQSDYEEMKRELTIMKSMEFQTSENEDTSQQKSLEVLLLEKNRSLQSENTSLKLSTAELNSDEKSSQQQVRKCQVVQKHRDVESRNSHTTDTASPNTSQASSTPPPPLLPSQFLQPIKVTAPSVQAYPSIKKIYQETGEINTNEIARIIKDLLLMYNIGQRVFGEYVLAMSQGSVSEILARPKPWDKLTVKGREPFIKMMDFLADEENIQTLLIINAKKKGKDIRISTPPNPPLQALTSTPVNTCPKDSTEEAITQILTKARKEMEAMSSVGHFASHRGGADYSNSPKRSSPERLRPLRHSAFKPYSETIVERHPVSLFEQEPQTEAIPLIKKVKNSDGSPEPPVDKAVQNAMPSGDENTARVQRAIQQAIQESNCVLDSQMFSMSPSFLAMAKPLKRVLPPLTSQHYEKYPELNTRHVTMDVKERLNKFLIPQRLFGDHVLGLSQGSVSDILSHPKPWSKLTQKGREPFIRMQLWLEDDEAIEKLKVVYGKKGEVYDDNLQEVVVNNSKPANQLPGPTRPSAFEDTENSSTSSTNSTDRLLHEQYASLPELDTYDIARRVKIVLYENNIGQRVFGEIVLGLTQGSVSDLLSKPKPWNSLSLKGKEPFIRMHMWLNDKDGVQRLKNIKMERKASHKRRSSTCNDVDSHHSITLTDFSPMKKPRTLLTQHEKDALFAAYKQEPYPSQSSIDFLAAELNLLPSTVTNWFHNHRSRSKRGQLAEEQSRMHEDSSGEVHSPLSASGELRLSNNGGVHITPNRGLENHVFHSKRDISSRAVEDDLIGMEERLEKSGVVVVKPEPVEDDDDSACQYSKEHWYVGGEEGRPDYDDHTPESIEDDRETNDKTRKKLKEEDPDWKLN